MKIRTYYCCKHNKKLEQSLLEQQIRFEKNVNLGWLTFYLYEEEQLKINISKYHTLSVIPDYEFDDEEFLASKFLVMRSKNGKLDCKEPDKTYEYFCEYEKEAFGFKTYHAHHKRQIGLFAFSPNIKWGQTHFYSSYLGGFETIFCDDIAMRCIINSEMTGVHFDPVIAYKKGCYAENIHQIVIDNFIHDDMLIIDDTYERKTCPFCGKVQYVGNYLSRIRVKKEALGQDDFYRTNDLFNDGFPDPYLIVSNKVYRILTEQKLSRNLVFHPLLTV